MFCPNCGTQNSDNAAFCGKCGSPISARPASQAQPAGNAPGNAPGAARATTPGPMYSQGSVPVGKTETNNRIVLIALIAIAVVAVVAIIVGFVTCSGIAGKTNLNSLVSDDADKVAASVEKMSAGKVDGMQYYMPDDDTKSLMKKASDAFGAEKKKMKDLTEDIKRQNPWGIAMLDDDRDILTLKDLQKGKDPSTANYVTYRVIENPTCEDIAKIAAEVCDYDKIIVSHSNGHEYYGGYAMKGDGEVMFSISASGYEGVYHILISAVRLDEVPDEDRYIDNFEVNYNDHEDMNWDEEYLK